MQKYVPAMNIKCPRPLEDQEFTSRTYTLFEITGGPQGVYFQDTLSLNPTLWFLEVVLDRSEK